MNENIVGSERERLSKESVIDRALEMADDGGLEALTIRKLAQSLGVTPMALYWHFRSKEELLDGLAERVWGEIDVSLDASAPWIAQFRRLVESLVGVLRAHPAAPDLFLRYGKRNPSSLRATEVALEVLRGAGFDQEHASAIARSTLWTGLALVLSDPALHPGKSAEEWAEHQRKDLITMSTLSPERFPRVVECAVQLAMCPDPESHYRFGIDMFVAGVEAVARQRQ